jgi:hypothetical protein
MIHKIRPSLSLLFDSRFTVKRTLCGSIFLRNVHNPYLLVSVLIELAEKPVRSSHRIRPLRSRLVIQGTCHRWSNVFSRSMKKNTISSKVWNVPTPSRFAFPSRMFTVTAHRCPFQYYQRLEKHIRDELKKQLNELDRILAKYERDRSRMTDRTFDGIPRETAQANDWVRRRKEVDAHQTQVIDSHRYGREQCVPC